MVNQSERTLLLRVLGDTDSASGAIRALRTDVQGTGQDIDALGGHFDHLRQSSEAVGKVNLGPLKSDIGDLAGVVPGLGGAIEHAGTALEHLNADAKSGQSEAALLAGGIAGIGVAATAVSFETFEQGVHSIHLLAEETGLSEEKVAGFQLSLREAGLGADVANTAIMMVQRNLLLLNQNLDEGKEPTGNFAKGLQALGIDINSTAVRSGELSQLLPVLADRFKAEKEQAEASGTSFNGAGIAIELFGRRGAAMVPVLEQGSAGLKQNEAFVRSLGLANEEQVKHLEAWETASARAEVAATALGAKIGSDVAPALTAVARATSDALSFLDKMPGSLSAVVIGLPLLAAGTIAGAAGLAKLFDIAGTGISALVNVGGAISDFASKSLVARDAGMAAAEGEAAVGTASATAGGEAAAGAAGFGTLATAEGVAGKGGTEAAVGEAAAGTAATAAGGEAAAGAAGFGTLATAEGVAGKGGTEAAVGEAAAGTAATAAGGEAAVAATQFSLLAVPLGVVAGILGGALVAGLANSRDTMQQEVKTVSEAQIQHAQLTALLAREVQQHGQNSSAAKELRDRIAELDSSIDKLSGTQSASAAKMQQGIEVLRGLGVDVEHLGKVHLTTAEDVKKAGDDIVKEEGQVRDATHAAVMAEISDKTILAEAERRIAAAGGILTQEQIADIRNLAQENQARADKAEAASQKAANAWRQEATAAETASASMSKDVDTMAATYQSDAEKMAKAFSPAAEKTKADWEQIKSSTQSGAQATLAVIQSLQGQIAGVEQQLTGIMDAENRKRLDNQKTALEGQLQAAQKTFDREVSAGSEAASKLAEIGKQETTAAQKSSDDITNYEHQANIARIKGKDDEAAGYLQAIELEKQGDHDGAVAAIDAGKEAQTARDQQVSSAKQAFSDIRQLAQELLDSSTGMGKQELQATQDMYKAEVDAAAVARDNKLAIMQIEEDDRRAQAAFDLALTIDSLNNQETVNAISQKKNAAAINAVLEEEKKEIIEASKAREAALEGEAAARAAVAAAERDIEEQKVNIEIATAKVEIALVESVTKAQVEGFGSSEKAGVASAQVIAVSGTAAYGAVEEAAGASFSAQLQGFIAVQEAAIAAAKKETEADKQAISANEQLAASYKASADAAERSIAAAKQGAQDAIAQIEAETSAVDGLGASLAGTEAKASALGETLRSATADTGSLATASKSMNETQESGLNIQIAQLQVMQDHMNENLRTERTQLTVLKDQERVLQDETGDLQDQLNLQRDMLAASPEYEQLRGQQLQLQVEKDRLTIAGEDTTEVDKQIRGISDQLKLMDDQNNLASFGLQQKIDAQKVDEDRNKLQQNQNQLVLDQAKAEDDVSGQVAIQITYLQEELKLLQDMDKTVEKITSTAASGIGSGGGGGGPGNSLIRLTNPPSYGSRGLAAGGVLDEPVVGIGTRTGTSYSLAESGPEAVVPLGVSAPSPGVGLPGGPGAGGGITIAINLYDTRILAPGDIGYWADVLSKEIYNRLSGQVRTGARV